MADLRIVDAPVLLQESITDDVKMPTGGLGNYAIRLGDLVWYVVAKENLASKSYVDNSSKGVKDSLDVHIANKANPHEVTKEQVGLGNVDNTADIDKPVSNAVRSAITTATTDMATKAYVNSKDGDLTTLTTTNKTSLVKAINEVVSVKADKATTLLGYGITDAYTKSEIDTNYGGVKTLYDKNVVAGAGANGWTAELIVDKSGATQQQVNYNGGSKWHSRVGGYLKNERVVLANGDIVKSTIDGNINDPNVNMTGWKLDKYIYVYSIAELKSLKVPVGSRVTLHDGGRSGTFFIKSATEQVALDVTRPAATTVTLTSAASSDTFNAIYVQTQNGVAVREVNTEIHAGWFGVTYDWDNTTQAGTDNSLNFEAAMHYALSQQLLFVTGGGSIRITKMITTQKDGYWKLLRWEAKNTKIIVDYAGSGIRVYGGAYVFVLIGTLNIEKSNQYKTVGGNSFPPTTTLTDFLATKNAGVIFDGNKHEVSDIRCKGFNVGALFDATVGNMNYSKHNIIAEGNDVGVLIFGTGNDLSVIKSKIVAGGNFQEAIYVKDGVNFRQWVCTFHAENNLLDRKNDPSVAGRYAVYIGHHITCDIWCYVEQYTPGTLELYVSETGSSRIYSARINKDQIRGNNQGYFGNTLYQNLWQNEYAIRQAVPLKLQGRGVQFNTVGNYVDLPFITDNNEYGGLRGEAGRIKLRSTTSAQEVALSDSDMWMGKRFNTVVVDAVTLTKEAPTTSKTIKTLSVSSEGAMGTIHVIGGAFRSSHGYAPYVLKVDFYIASGVITLNEAGKFYNNPASGKSSASLRLDGNTLFLDLSYEYGWWGDNYKFKYKVEILTGMV